MQALVADGRLSAGHARALIGSAEAERLARAVVDQGLSVRETEELVRRETARPRQARTRGLRGADPHVRELEERLTSRLG